MLLVRLCVASVTPASAVAPRTKRCTSINCSPVRRDLVVTPTPTPTPDQARCDILVGKFTSGLFRAAYQLSAAEHGLLRPFVSLDAPWCAGRK